MALLIAKLFSIVDAIAAHLVEGTFAASKESDLQWVITNNLYPSVKANTIAASVADILLYGVQMVNQIVQLFVVPTGTSVSP